ncbi:hypothetical protein JI58_02345 [Marinosulfonomonas sp. PRT-SC04]|nr:hypothetical protein JI58_02345 [Marinosulfonomonas sp. PRT-SC04]
MLIFCSFFIFKQDEIDLIHAICSDAGWTTSSITDPSTRFRFSANGMAEFSQASALSSCPALQEGQEHGQLLLFATEKDDAENIIELIRASLLMLVGFPDRFGLDGASFLIPDDPIERESIFQNVFRTDGYFQKFIWREELVAAVAIAAKAWSDSKLVYAIHKLAHSISTESVSPHSMHPQHGQIFEKHSCEFSSHVGTSVAVNLAYSAIEELGLGIPSSRENPRWIKGSTYEWNPKVLKKIEKRLLDANIGPNRTIDWILRGDETEVKPEPVRNSLTNYSDGQRVRDVELSLPDAINSCECLRNCLTAHAFKSDTALLGPYEVFNCQQVARFLILSKCQLFNVWTEELRARFLPQFTT